MVKARICKEKAGDHFVGVIPELETHCHSMLSRTLCTWPWNTPWATVPFVDLGRQTWQEVETKPAPRQLSSLFINNLTARATSHRQSSKTNVSGWVGQSTGFIKAMALCSKSQTPGRSSSLFPPISFLPNDDGDSTQRVKKRKMQRNGMDGHNIQSKYRHKWSAPNLPSKPLRITRRALKREKGPPLSLG